MNDIIYSGKHVIGDRIAITNHNAVAATYRADFGEAGAVLLTLAPGTEFEVTVGTHGPQVYLEHVSEAGLCGT